MSNNIKTNKDTQMHLQFEKFVVMEKIYFHDCNFAFQNTKNKLSFVVVNLRPFSLNITNIADRLIVYPCFNRYTKEDQNPTPES